MVRIRMLLSVLAIAALPLGANAANTFPIVACANCTSAQMMALAKNTAGTGVRFVYSLPTATIRKYDVALENTGTIVAPSTDEIADDANDTGTDAMVRVVTPMSPVDPDIANIFNAMVSVYLHHPSLLQAHDTVTISNVGNDPLTHQPFDPRQIAWEYPQGTYGRFMQMVQMSLANPISANAMSPSLGDELFGVNMAGFNVTVTISAGPAVAGSATFDFGQAIEMDICDANSNCAVVMATPKSAHALELTFKESIDIAHNQFPMPNFDKTDPRTWSWPAGSSGLGNAFGNWIHGRGIEVDGLGLGCGMASSYYLSCANLASGAPLGNCTVTCR